MHLFYCDKQEGDLCTLSQDESQHCAKVLRLKVGDTVMVTNGNGYIYECDMVSVSHKECIASINKTLDEPSNDKKRSLSHIVVAPTKNIDRVEWFIEKAIEVGIGEISFIKTSHSERTTIKMERLQKIAVSAMKQSQQAFLPKINDICTIKEFIKRLEPRADQQKYIAYCGEYEKIDLSRAIRGKEEGNIVVMIGPEGDFSAEEVNLCFENGYIPVTLGSRRLRTETAALYASWMIEFSKGLL